MTGRLDAAVALGDRDQHFVDTGLQIMADRQAIEDLSVRYAASLDERDWLALEGCFLPLAVYRHPGGLLHGFPAILDRIRSALAPLSRTQHLLGNFRVEVEGDEARASCYFQAQHLRRGIAGTYTIAGAYADRLVRAEGGWRIEERRQTYSWTAGDRAVVARQDSSPGRA